MEIEWKRIENEVLDLFRKFSGQDLTLESEMSSISIDSLQFVKLIIALEDLYQIEIDDETLYVSNGIKVDDFYKSILHKLNIF